MDNRALEFFMNNQTPDVTKTAPIIYFALIFSQVLYGIMLVHLEKFDLGTFSPDPILIVLLSMAGFTPLIGQFLSKRFIGKAKSEVDVLTALIIGWALAECACIFGFVASMISGQGTPYLATLAYSLSFFIRLRPSRELFNRVLEPAKRTL